MITEWVSALDDLARQFSTPQREFSPVPIWWWSGDRLERGRLRWQMEQLMAGGVYNVVILNLAPTGPLYGSDPDQPRFMSDEWWDIFLGVCEDAQTLGMRIWFYDQIGFSGANLQGEIVRETPAYAGQSLTSLTIEGEGALELECPTEGIPLAAAWIALDDNGKSIGESVAVSLNGRTAHVDTPGRKRLRLMYAIRRGFDYFSPDACAQLLDTVHYEFERRASHYFGTAIVGSFQDELPTLPTWSAGFADAFKRLKGYELSDHLIALWESEDANSERIRVDYHQVRALLAEEAFFKPCFEWHRKQGLVCGFDQQGPARSGHPIGGVQLYANYLQTHRWYDAPGSDHHGDAKIHSSLAHLYERPRVWIESFHSSGWGGTLEETFDWLLPWVRAGATLYNPHAVYYSTWGGWWEWAPPSTCWRQPYWRHYNIYADTISRLCFLLSQGTHVCDIGILYPTTTIQSGLTIEGALASAQAANDTYTTLTGRMMFLEMVTGTLDAAGRDFDVLDDASVQRGEIDNGALQIGAERFKAIILPNCKVIDAATVDKLTQFVEAGGLLVAIGNLPDHILDAPTGQAELFQSLFTSGKAFSVPDAADVTEVLNRFPRAIEAPVPMLHRRIHGADVLFVPAAFPHATQSHSANWLKAEYDFDPARYQRPMKIVVRGFSGTPQLWDAVTGECRAVSTTPREDGVEVEIAFDSAPAALLVWSEDELRPVSHPEHPASRLLELPDEWACILEQTLDNRYGDFTKPNFQGAPPVQTWHFEHRIERTGDDGLRDRWYESWGDESWDSVIATFGVYGWWSGARLIDQLPSPLSGIAPGDQLTDENWQPVIYSRQRGIHKDELHVPTLGPKGHVPEEFLAFGQLSAGQGVQFRTAVWIPEGIQLYLALAAPARKQAWVNGQPIADEMLGYLSIFPIQLKAGINLIEWRVIAEIEVNLRAYWALVTDPAAFARPERMIPGDAARKDSRLTYTLQFDVPFEPVSATFQVSADSTCRLLVNNVEAGRQGGFDPYASLARVQPYTITNCRQGVNSIAVELQDIGAPEAMFAGGNFGQSAVMVDGIVRGRNGESFSVISGSHWQVQRDSQAARQVALYRPQWLDPAWSHLWRRPHPLPDAAWLDGTPGNSVVFPVVPDALAGNTRVEWFRWTLPPGATAMHLPVAGKAQIWADQQELPVDNQIVQIPPSDRARRVVSLRVEPERGRSGGGVFNGPVTYETETGRIRLGEWALQGLETYSGGVRYQTVFSLERVPDNLVLDLGKVRGTAEVWVNGQPAGARVWSPYEFAIQRMAVAGRNILEILVLNTVAPYLQTVSPTHYVRPGQTVSGLMGPVCLCGTVTHIE